jgi:anti-sigma regulatory factor (Ser/Thr protein kinase)
VLPDAHRCVVDTADMTDLRRTAASYAAANGLTVERTQDLVLALTELASNSLEHAHSSATVLFGTGGTRVICQVRDTGHITDPLAGRRPAPPDQIRGRGLLLVNQLSDLVRIHTSQDGTTVEIQFTVG